ncbi:MAG TPA: amidohydrolase [Chthoniobacteraceae bacterium]|nr:amidohydrolase [Chthoniobacteraceae bacterium]
MLKKEVELAVAAEAKPIQEIASQIHSYAEPAFKEFKSSKLLADYLSARGFKVEFPFRNIPTAFRASWGVGAPTIGMLGEYDALPGCGEKEGEWGHGCGHNLLGTAPAAGAVAAKAVMEKAGLRGRVVYYGCPAEETLAGKVYMARDGAFRDLSVALAWHPSPRTEVNHVGGAAMDSLVLEFFGRTAHAGGSPHLGRSALDGVILLDVAVNYLREHVRDNVRIHSVIRNGGEAPNVVPGYAKCWYFVRARNRAEVDEVRERLLACARGAAEATGTEMKWERLTGVYDRLPNDALGSVLDRNLRLFGPPRATRADRELVKSRLGLSGEFDDSIGTGSRTPSRASSDETNVSWLVPFCRFQMACYIKGTPSHHRHLTIQAALPFAGRGLLQSAKVFASTALDLFQNPAELRKVKAEFRKRTRGFEYDPLVGKTQKVPIDPP